MEKTATPVIGDNFKSTGFVDTNTEVGCTKVNYDYGSDIFFFSSLA